MNINKNNFTYLGIDETSLGIQKGLIVVATQTKNPEETKCVGYNILKKARDYLKEAEALKKDDSLDMKKVKNLPSFKRYLREGMEKFYWMRISNGRFKRQIIEHLSIARMITYNGFDPKKTILLIDSFHGKENSSKYIIHEYLKLHEFNMPLQNIQIIQGGDKSVPLINKADLLAFSIGLYLNNKFSEYKKSYLNFPVAGTQVDFEHARLRNLINEENRKELEQIVAKWK